MNRNELRTNNKGPNMVPVVVRVALVNLQLGRKRESELARSQHELGRVPVADNPRWGLESCVPPGKTAHAVMDRLESVVYPRKKSA